MKDLKKFVCAKKKFPSDYNEVQQKAIKTITDEKYKRIFFGSSVFKNLIYAGDIDLIQHIPINKIVSSMQYVINRVLKNNYIIGDIKAGVRPEYAVLIDYLGKIENGIIKNYKPELIKNFGIRNNINEIINPPSNYGLTINKWLELFNTIHNLITIRWRPKDILNGFIIDSGKKYYMEDTIRAKPDDALNKIDIYYMDNDRLVELTNIFTYKFPEEGFVYGISLGFLNYLMPDKLNYLKALKRAYSISRIMPTIFRINDLNKIAPIMISRTNKFNTISTDLNLILDIIKVNDNLSKNHIEQIKTHLINLLNRIKIMGFDIPKINNLIIDALNNMNNKNNFQDLLKTAKNEVLKITNTLTKKYIKEYNINLNNFLP